MTPEETAQELKELQDSHIALLRSQDRTANAIKALNEKTVKVSEAVLGNGKLQESLIWRIAQLEQAQQKAQNFFRIFVIPSLAGAAFVIGRGIWEWLRTLGG